MFNKIRQIIKDSPPIFCIGENHGWNEIQFQVYVKLSYFLNKLYINRVFKLKYAKREFGFPHKYHCTIYYTAKPAKYSILNQDINNVVNVYKLLWNFARILGKP